jgi:hypothetical protein
MRCFVARVADESSSCGLQRHGREQLLRLTGDSQRISQRAAEAFEANLHYIAVFQREPVAKTERIRAEEMNVYVTRPAMSFVLEVMMLQIGEAVGHGGIAARDLFRPDRRAAVLDEDFSRHGAKIRIDNQFGPQARRCRKTQSPRVMANDFIIMFTYAQNGRDRDQGYETSRAWRVLSAARSHVN